MTCLPRMYVGYHHLSDLVAGASLGVLSVAVALRTPLPAGVAATVEARLRGLSARAPAVLLLVFFALGAECLHVFESTRKVAAATSEFARAIVADPGGEAADPAPAVLAYGG